MGKWIMIVGALLLVIGALAHFAPWLFSWFGRLPGDIRIEGENSRLYIPLVSMLLLSVALSLLVHLARRL